MISLYTKTLATQNRERKFIPMGKEAHSYSKNADIQEYRGGYVGWFIIWVLVAISLCGALLMP